MINAGEILYVLIVWARQASNCSKRKIPLVGQAPIEMPASTSLYSGAKSFITDFLNAGFLGSGGRVGGGGVNGAGLNPDRRSRAGILPANTGAIQLTYFDAFIAVSFWEELLQKFRSARPRLGLEKKILLA